jgi:hypothetical protein
MESGDGAKSERLYQDMATIINDNNAVEHKCYTLLEGPAHVVTGFAEMYDEYRETAGGEDAAMPTNAKVEWKELPLLFKTLKKVYDVMHADYTKSGHHEPDAMKYTDRARKAVGVKSTITALNAYYFFVLAWCHGDVMKSFNAFLDVKFVGEVVTSPPKSSAKKTTNR